VAVRVGIERASAAVDTGRPPTAAKRLLAERMSPLKVRNHLGADWRCVSPLVGRAWFSDAMINLLCTALGGWGEGCRGSSGVEGEATETAGGSGTPHPKREPQRSQSADTGAGG